MNKTNSPLITIAVTCFNAEKSIERAIKSAQSQTYPNLEIIVVDDCSSDKSVQIIKKFKNVKLIQHTENQGPAAARQTLLENAKGEFIAFFDDDDESDEERLRLQLKRIIEYEKDSKAKLIACYASGKRIYPNGYTLNLQAIGSHPIVPHGPDVADRLLYFKQTKGHFFGSGTPTCSLMARASTLKSVGGFDINFRRVEDIDIAIRIALKGGHFIGCPEQLFTQYATESSDKAPEKNVEAEIQLAEKYRTYLKSKGRYFYSKTWPKLRYYHFTKQYCKMLKTLIILFANAPIKTTSHFLISGPRRIKHEQKMK